MTPSDVAVVIGAGTAAVTATTAAFIAVLREVRKVHKLVNQSATDAKAYNLLLANTLRLHGVIVPVDAAVKKEADAKDPDPPEAGEVQT